MFFKIGNRHKSKNAFYLIPMFSLIVSLNLAGCKSEARTGKNQGSEMATPAPVLTVTAIKPVFKNIAQTLNVTGTIAAWDLLSVSPSVNGLKVVGINTEAGNYVHKGQVLVKLDDSMLQAQLLSARARLANAEAQLSKARQPNRSQDISRQQAALSQAEANLENARANASRFESLFAKGAISKSDLDLRRTTLETSEALYNQEKQRLSLLIEGSRVEDINIANATVADARAQIEQLKVQLAQTSVLSPDDGLVLDRLVHYGDISSSQGKLFNIVRNNRFELQAKVPENDLRMISPGSLVEISSDANPDLKTTGKVRQIGPGVDQASRQATVKIDLVNIPGLQTGQFVKGKITTGSIRRLIIPAKSIINTDGTEHVFVLDKDIARSQPVITGTRSGNMVEVVSGLKEPDRIIGEGAGFISDGDKVKIASNQQK
jgi:HlyD family secretion protein